MFIGRKKELKQLSTPLSSWKRKTAVLIYGKRRMGKSTLIQQAAKSFKGIVINYMCVSSTFEGNLDLIYRSVSDGLGIPNIKFDSLFAMMDYLKTLDKKILLVIDEYQYRDILPPPKEAGASSRQQASSQFSFDSTNVLSISELTPCAPRFCIIGYARTIRIPSFLMFIAAFTSLS